MFFTFNSSKYYSHPHTIVPEQFGGDGVSTISQQINMTAEEEAIAIAEFNANTARQLRENEYPPIGDQLDALWKGGEAAAEMLAKVQAIKTKYPKSE